MTLNWWLKNIYLLALVMVMMGAWSVPAPNTWEFWVGLFAFGFYAGSV